MPETAVAYRQAYLEFSFISKSFPTPNGVYPVLEEFELGIFKGEFVSLIGHSGCGKSTLLMLAAGLSQPTRGGIILDGRQVDEPGPDRGVVFQAPYLFPWMTAMENVLLGVSRVFPNKPLPERKEMCRHYLGRVGLEDACNTRAHALSNGMKQRVSIARAFALKPKLLLLDEPFGMLDSLTRAELQDTLMDIWFTEKITALLVTHDIDEALLLSDRVVMMTSGPRARVGDVLQVPFERPRDRQHVIERPDYYQCRGHLMDFLHGKTKQEPVQPDPSVTAAEHELQPATCGISGR